jgi:hypothetical protein
MPLIMNRINIYICAFYNYYNAIIYIGRVVCIAKGCQKVYFETKSPNLDKFWRVVGWKSLFYYMAIWNMLWPFGTFYGHTII